MAGLHAEFISDTHLNMWKYTPEQISAIFPGTSPTLILAGDIGDPDESALYTTLNIVRTKYKNVVYVPGNHEFYNREPGSKKTSASVLSWFQRLDDTWDNFHFFYRRNMVIDGVRILGATGWSTSPKDTDWAHTISQEGKKDIEFLQQNVSHSKEPVLVVTHYPSTLRALQEKFKYKITQYDYAQDLEYMYRYPIHTWIFGHVHQSHDFKVPYSSSMCGSGHVRVLCNPYGYPSDGINSPHPKSILIDSSSSVKSPVDTLYQSSQGFP